MRRVLAPVLLVLLAPAGMWGYRQILDREYVVTGWMTDDGLPESSATSILEASDGFLLVGTFGGLVRYDGNRFQTMLPGLNAVLPNVAVVALHQDSRGVLWASTLSGPATFDGHSIQAVPNPAGSWSDIVLQIESGVDGAVYARTSSHRLLYRKGKTWMYLPDAPVSQDRPYLLRDGAGEVCYAAGETVMKWVDNAWRRIVTIPRPDGDPILAWGAAREGGWWAASQGSILRVAGGQVVQRIRASARLRDLGGVLEDDRRNLWVHSYTSGLYRVQPDGQVREFSRRTGFFSDSIRFVSQDKWGNIWVGTNGDGLLRLRRRIFASYGEESGLPAFPVKSVAMAPDRSVLVATYGDGVYRLQDGKARPAFPGVRGPKFTQALLVDRQRRLWIGSYQDGLWMSDRVPPRQTLPIDASGATIEALYEDGQGRIWIGSSNGIAVFENGRYRFIDVVEKRNPVPIAAFAEADGVMWAGGDGGLYRLQGDRFVPVKDTAGNPLPGLRAILAAPDQSLWLGAVSAGLLQFQNGAVRGVPNPYGKSVSVGAIDRRGEWIWLCTSEGVWRVREADLRNAADGRDRGRWRLFGKEDGIPSVETSIGHQPITTVDPEGRLWVSTLKGVIYASLATPEDASPAALILERITYRESSGAEKTAAVGANGEVLLPPGSQDIRIFYTTTHQAAPERVLFSCQLENSDGPASEILTDRREIQLFKLALGENLLRLRASNGDAVWSGQPTVLRLYQTPATWQKRPVRAAAAALLTALILLAIYLWAAERKRRYERELRQVMEAEAERKKLAEQLAQSQKMESVGQLAGGVAHDFNNLLTVINGYSKMAMDKLHPSDPLWRHLEQIHRAGERASALTAQLLAFSRKQILQPRVLDLNSVVSGMDSMLRRLVGEDIEIRLSLWSGLASVKADQHQIEQVIMNLAVNARDAMPRGGEIAIVTRPAVFDEAEARRYPGAAPGEYVALSLRDSGEGMDEATRQRIFEPFFTTKGPGKGTGLGLSMVQGIVSQSGGVIEVESRPGEGATFTIYLPGTSEEELADADPAAARAARGSETVLIVEDQAQVRRFAADALRDAGFRVMEADGVDEALRYFGPNAAPIHLVLSDLVMPGKGGRALAETLRAMNVDCPIVFMSGYSSDVIANQGALPDGVSFLEKPFGPDALIAKVRSVLDSHA